MFKNWFAEKMLDKKLKTFILYIAVPKALRITIYLL